MGFCAEIFTIKSGAQEMSYLSSSKWWSVNKVVKVCWSKEMVVSRLCVSLIHKQIAHDLKLQNLAYLLFSTSKNIYLEIFTLVQPNQGPVFGRKVSRSLTEHSASQPIGNVPYQGPLPRAAKPRAPRSKQATHEEATKKKKQKEKNKYQNIK